MFAGVQVTHLRVLFVSGLIAVTSIGALPASAESQSTKLAARSNAQVAESYGKLPLSFEANSGQTDSQVKFLARGSGYGLYLTADQAVLSLRKNACAAPSFKARSLHASSCAPQNDVVSMRLSGSKPTLAGPVGEEPLSGTANYFIGNNASQWRQRVPTYSRVRYSAVYPGVDLLYYGNQSKLEYDFVVAPQADPNLIRLEFAGVRKLKLDAQGNLLIAAKDGSIAFHKPVVYQHRNGSRFQVEGRFTLLAHNTIGFTLGAYDRTQPLIIDPVLAYSTYLGGASTYGDMANAIAVDSAGNVYLAGVAGSTNFPVTTGVYQAANSGAANKDFNAFVAKLNPKGTALVYSTYLGGSLNTYAYGLAVDASGDAYVTGSTFATNFPVTSGVYQTTNKTANAGYTTFVTKVNPSGTALVYSSYLGGGGNGAGTGETGNAIALDASGNVYIAGITYSASFPTTAGAFQTTNPAAANGIETGFVSKLNSTATALVYSTFLGGSGTGMSGESDQAYAIAVDASGDAYITGSAASTNFPTTTSAYQLTNKAAAKTETSAFVTKLNPAGSAPVYSTFLGGSQNAEGYAIALDTSGDAYVAGAAMYTDFPVTTGSYQTANNAATIGATNAFVTKLNPAGSALVYSTLLGGSGVEINSSFICGDSAAALAVDSSGNAYLTGIAYSTNFPVTSGAFQATNAAATTKTSNAFMSELNPAGSALLYSTYLGGTGVPIGTTGTYAGDSASALAIDATGGVYLTGAVDSSNFPVTTGAYQLTNKSAVDTATNAFISKIEMINPVATTTAMISSANPQNTGGTVTFTATVSPATGTTIPTGSVVFSVNGATAATVALNASGVATYTTTTLAAGSDSVTAAYGGAATFSASTSAVLTETINNPVATAPVFSPAVGTYTSAQSVTLADSTTGATICYTTNGTTPTASSTKYTAAIAVSKTTTIEAIAIAPGYSNSVVASGTYTITPVAATPVISPAAGSYTATQSVTITDSTSGATIYYTTNGTAPTTSSTKYSGAIAVGTSETIEAIAVATGYTSSAIASSKYTVTLTAATPVITPAAGTYTTAQSVTITDSTTGATIYYTTNGTAPTTASSKYTAAIAVSASETIEAIAVATGYTNSAVASSKYTLNLTAATPVITPAAGTYTSAQSVTITDSTSGATIYYTTNGTAPTTASTKYTAAIAVSASETVEAIAVATGYTNSAVASAAYVIAKAPTVTSAAATSLTTTGAKLNGTVTANNATTQYWFAYGASSTSLTSTTTKSGSLTGATATAETATLTGLKAAVTYYFQIVASNSAGTTAGTVLSFTTP